MTNETLEYTLTDNKCRERSYSYATNNNYPILLDT